MKYLSVCSGIEAATVAWHPLDWKPVAFSEIEPFPSAVLAHHYPDVPNLGDMTKHKEWPLDSTVDLLVGGTPCFPGETLVAAQRGLVPIREINIGDYVLTHKNRWRKVLRVGSKNAPTIRLRGQGQSTGLITTAEHPFYARKKTRKWVGRANGNWVTEMSPPKWVEAKDMEDLYWASPSSWPKSEPPPIETRGNEHQVSPMSDALAWVVGRWLGDGWTRISQRRGYVFICCADSEADDLADRLIAAGLTASRSKERTTTRYQIASKALARWLRDEFGAGAANKTMPTWVFGWEHRKALWDGYLSADGCHTTNGWRLTTVSDRLALGATLLAHSLGWSASRRLVTPKRDECVIEGRVVRERPFWQITAYSNARSSVDMDGHRWGLVRRVEIESNTEVFNIEVEGDNSYVADGIVVHNCQSFSVAGLRKGMADPRGNLALVFLAIADRIRPRWILWENVPGVLSSNGGRDFGAFLGALGELGYGWAYRVLDAQHFGVPQRRRRVFVVGHLGDWQRAAAVLFERQSLSGDSPPRRETREDVTVAAPLGAHKSGRRQDLDNETYVTHSLRADGFDASEDGTGRGTPLVPVVGALACNTGPNGHDAGNFACNQAVDAGHVLPVVRCQKCGEQFYDQYGTGIGALAPYECPRCGEEKRIVPVAFDLSGRDGGAMPEGAHDTANIRAASGGSSRSYIPTASAVRRLTPEECEALQGFPRSYTAVPCRGKPAADGPRYRALGNSMAVPVMRWLGERIAMVDGLTQEP